MLAQDAPAEFTLDLNGAAETDGGACRLTYVVVNSSEIDLSRAAYEVAIFDVQGVVQRLIALDFGALSAGRTKVLQFDLPQMSCGMISRIIINDGIACEPVGGAEDISLCMDALTATSRTAIQFGL
ncbi:MAG: hypothetical protein II336_08995 [Loktanella sp.]|nr:hypothetical protein [Loktanella sp.]